MNENLLVELGIDGKPAEINLSTVDSSNSLSRTKIVNNLELCDMVGEKHDLIPVVYAQKIWPFGPEDSPRKEDFELEHLKDLEFTFLNSEVNLIIGMNRPEMLKPLEIISGPSNSVYASRHKLGWAISGPVKRGEKKVISNRVKVANADEIENLIKSMYDKDFSDSHLIGKEPSQEDKKWESIMVSSVKLTPDSHYEINLPLRPDAELSFNRSQVFHSFLSLLRKLQADPEMSGEYKEFMQTMISKGFVERVSSDELEADNAYYLTHHGVYHKQKNKLRIVFNCSLPFKGKSLNDSLYQGPDLTNSILGVLLRFRQEKIAFIGDISKMFYQVRVSPENRDYLRFFWLSDSSDFSSAICEYRLTVHVFGATSSPSVANFALRQTVKDNPNHNEKAKEAVLRNFYVDDLLCSASNVDEASNLLLSVKELILKGGFELTGFVSNSPELLNLLKDLGLSEDLKEVSISEKTPLVLGLKWDTENDNLKFKINLQNKALTRRDILSIIHGIYDPLGLSGPAVIPAKLIFQETCRLRLDWDTELPPEIQSKWLEFLRDLPLLEQYGIPRCCMTEPAEEIELHFFSDGSDAAFGSIAYVRFLNKNGSIHCAPLLAKARLAPLHNSSYHTIPRIELNGAKLSVILKQIIDDELEYEISRSYFWTDSTTVLKYIACEDKKQERFISNRVSFIRCNTEVSQWRYVPSNENPADCISRGISIPQFLQLNSWIKGPEFLWRTEQFWPNQIQNRNNEIEMKNCENKCFVSNAEQAAESATEDFLNYSSGWYKTKKRVSWLNRFASFLNNKNECQKGSLTVAEMQRAENCIIRYVQRKHFSSTIIHLNQNRNLPRTDPLRKFNPFLDQENILRVGGRLKHSDLEETGIHPAIMTGKSRLTLELIEEKHKLLGHMGRESIVSTIRQKYWIVGLYSVIKKILFNCPTCRKLNAQPTHQKMASLPEDRVTANEPAFTRVGTDYFGPFEVLNGRKHEKRYGVIFTCLSSRAMHLEMSYSLSTDSFINAFRRFVARRGVVKVIRSDNGTNLVGGCKELKEAVNHWNKNMISSWMLQRNIDWKFQPPNASHFGGVFEREIRSVRKVLRGLLNEQPVKLSDELLCTLFCEIESILNCRPLTELSQDADDLEALTPNHLLLLHSGVTFPPGLFTKHDSYSSRRWKQVQYFADVFWSRWRKEYLPLLQQRQKWLNDGYKFKIGDIVLVTDQMLPRNQWALGRVTEIFPDDEGRIRVVKVKTARIKDEKSTAAVSELKRPINKLILIKSC